MRYMMMVKSTPDSEAGCPLSPALMEVLGKLGAEMAAAGVLLDTARLLPSSQGARIQVSGGQTSVVDGPFAETKELVGGYAILAADSREEALELGRRFMQIHADVLGPEYEGELEIRPMVEMGPPPGQS